MRGLITYRDVVRNAGLIRKEFGALCLFRCVVAMVTRRRTTFLAMAVSQFNR